MPSPERQPSPFSQPAANPDHIGSASSPEAVPGSHPFPDLSPVERKVVSQITGQSEEFIEGLAQQTRSKGKPASTQRPESNEKQEQIEKDPVPILAERLQKARSQLEHAGYPQDAAEVAKAIKRLHHTRAVGASHFVLWCKRWPRKPAIPLTPLDHWLIKFNNWWHGPRQPPAPGGAIVRRDGQIEAFNQPDQIEKEPPKHPDDNRGWESPADDARSPLQPGDEVITWMPEGGARQIIMNALQPETRTKPNGAPDRYPDATDRIYFQGLGKNELQIIESHPDDPTSWSYSQRTSFRFGSSIAAISF